MNYDEIDKSLLEADSEIKSGNYIAAQKNAANILLMLDDAKVSRTDNAFRARGMRTCAEAEWKKGCFDKALNYANNMLTEASKIGSELPKKAIMLAKAHNLLGLISWKQGNLVRALDNYSEALAISERAGSKMGVAIITGNIGLIYSSLSDYHRGREYYLQALDAHQELGATREIAEMLCNLGIISDDIGEYNEALTYLRRALDLFDMLGNKAEVARMIGNIGNVYFKLKEYELAYQHYINAIGEYEKLGLNEDISIVKSWLGRIFICKEFSGYNIETSKKYLTEALAFSKEMGAAQCLMYSYELLAEFHKNAEEWREYAKYLEEYHKIASEYYDEQAKKQAQRLAVEREMAALERERGILKVRNEELAALNAQFASRNNELLFVNEEKNEFLEIASHDLKNPLGSIVMLSNILQNESETLTPNEIRECGSNIRVVSERMLNLITNLLDVNKIDSGSIVIDRKTFLAGDVLLAAVGHFQSAANAKQIKINMKIQSIEINTSQTVLAQIADNLLSNAIKFSFPNTLINISADAVDGKLLRIKVTDQGPGFTDEDRKNIFGRFKRLSAQPTGGENSSGLGLSIVKKLVEMLGGQISFDSVLGKGTTFIVDLPL